MEWRERGLVEAGGEGGDWKERGEDFRAGRGEGRGEIGCIIIILVATTFLHYQVYYTYMHINRYRAVCFINIQCCCVQGRSEFRCIDLTLHALESQSSSSLKGGLGQVRITLHKGTTASFLEWSRWLEQAWGFRERLDPPGG